MGAACCSDKYLVPQRQIRRKGDLDDHGSVMADAGDDTTDYRPESKYQAKHYIAQAWGDEVAQGVIPITATPAASVLDKFELVHFRPHPSSQEDGLRKRPAAGTRADHIDPWVLGTMALTDFRRPAQNKVRH